MENYRQKLLFAGSGLSDRHEQMASWNVGCETRPKLRQLPVRMPLVDLWESLISMIASAPGAGVRSASSWHDALPEARSLGSTHGRASGAAPIWQWDAGALASADSQDRPLMDT